ncbi:MAG: hypothetical protein RBT69_08575 [Spirochaetia bacterium]|jgi:hypothetical protein|nr:hypothetical protein [Spirochaetia bacterium]
MKNETSAAGKMRITESRFTGAWMTDIDDTIIRSGEMPDEAWIKWISSKIEKLNRHNILWIPMSGVAIVKLGPRILYRLPDEILDSVLYYGGDGSQKYYYDSKSRKWAEDLEYKRVFTDEQTLAVIGKDEFLKTVHDGERYEKAASRLADGGFKSGKFKSEDGILTTMKKMLSDAGYDPALSETYFRGGSVSWMMLGDISADPYKTEKAANVRKKLIEYAEKTLEEEGHLKRFGKEGINIPFHGARGIKFVMMGNDKERGTRDLVENEEIKAENIVFAGNELFAGGNDNMIRKVGGVTILSVGEKTDPGENVIAAGDGIDANNLWLDKICALLDKGEKWEDILADIRERGKKWIG